MAARAGASTVTRATRRGALTYQPALDGLRALAVIAVLLYHQGTSFAPGGFLGVDAFFVLSGFLITSLLAMEWGRSGAVDVRAFWLRRVRRLFPALLVLLAGVALYAAFVALPGERHSIRVDGLATLFYVENWRLIFSHSSYFTQFSAPSPLRHAWSLAIEEQWYLVWPMAFAVMVRTARGRIGRLIPVVVGLAMLSAVWMAILYHPGQDPSRVYYGTDTRAQSLLIGSAFGLLFLRVGSARRLPSRFAIELAGLVSIVIAVIVVARVHDTSGSMYRGGLFALAVVFAVVITAAVQPGSPVLGRALSVEPLRLLGLVSYGIYLFHWPVFLWLTPTRTHLAGMELFALRCAVTLAVAAGSYVLIERPVRHGTIRRPHLRVLAPAAVVAVVVSIVAATMATTAPAAPASSGLPPPPPQNAGLPPAVLAAAAKRDARFPHVLKVDVAGDSLAFRFAFVDQVTNNARAATLGLYSFSSTLLGCGIADGKILFHGQEIPLSKPCATWRQFYKAGMKRADPDLSVLMVGVWEMFDHEVDGHLLQFGTAAYRRYLFSSLDDARAILTSNGAHMVLVGLPCFDRPVISDNDSATVQNDPARVAWINATWREYAAAHASSVTYLDFEPFLCPGGKADDVRHGVTLRVDGEHLTWDGAMLAWQWIAPQLRAIAARYPRPGEHAFAAADG